MFGIKLDFNFYKAIDAAVIPSRHARMTTATLGAIAVGVGVYLACKTNHMTMGRILMGAGGGAILASTAVHKKAPIRTTAATGVRGELPINRMGNSILLIGPSDETKAEAKRILEQRKFKTYMDT